MLFAMLLFKYTSKYARALLRFFLRSFRLLENDFVFLLIELAEANYRLLLPNIKKQ
jgi:hypothetical protein